MLDLLQLDDTELNYQLMLLVERKDPKVFEILRSSHTSLVTDLCHQLIDVTDPVSSDILDLLRLLCHHDCDGVFLPAIRVLVQQNGVAEWIALLPSLCPARRRMGINFLQKICPLVIKEE